ncbi:MAG: hypothetical protein LBK82_10080, partial [Planctomycetaceae bacterium]|nr:hypothetical protein [Planctomycetaceae bacterium]
MDYFLLSEQGLAEKSFQRRHNTKLSRTRQEKNPRFSQFYRIRCPSVEKFVLNAKRGGQSVRWTVAPVEFYSTPKRKAIQFAVVNLILCRLTPTRPFSERS